MAWTVAVHSRRGGTGKSRLAAAVGGLLAADGLRVGLVDTALQSPSLHQIFRLELDPGSPTLARHLAGRCEVEDAVHDVTGALGGGGRAGGALLLVPSSVDIESTGRLLLAGYDLGMLADAYRRLAELLRLDLLLLDTHPGTSSEASLSVALADTVLVVVRPDADSTDDGERPPGGGQADRLVVVNMVAEGTDGAALRHRLRGSVGEPAALVPYSRQMCSLGGPAVPADPEPVLHRELRAVADALVGTGRAGRTG
jgi:septum site-determining protein MinD